MGRKLDLSGLSDNEAEHVLEVVQRDMRLRKKEEERLSELKHELDEEDSRCLLLSEQSRFNQRCCIRCCSPFTFLLNPKRQCRDCNYNVCKACRVYIKQDKAWLCSACQKSRLLQTQSLEWFYTNVKRRFKRFGSAKVLKTLYEKHLVGHSALSELTESSAYEENIYNEGSVCGSDSTFYRQTEEHSMADTLTVALRVAEETIDEAISRTEFNTASQNEAHYLRENRGELIEELAQTIVQKIISRRKALAERSAGYDQNWPLEHDTDLHHHHHQSTCDHASSSLKHLWRSHSAFSLLDNDPPGLTQESLLALKKEGSGSAMSTWKSLDRLDNAMLKSLDGNWIALQSAQLSRPSLLTRRKSLVYSALEQESAVVSAYEGMGSDNEIKSEPDSSWGAVLKEIHRKMTDSVHNQQDTQERCPSSLMDRRGSRQDLFTDSEGKWMPNKPLLVLLKKKVPAEIRRPSSSRRTSIIDVNFNVEGAGEEEEGEDIAEQEVRKVRRPREKRKSEKEPEASSIQDFSKKESQLASDALTPDTLTSEPLTPEPFEHEGEVSGQTDQELTFKLQQLTGRLSDSSTGEEVDGGRESSSDVQMEIKRQDNEDRYDENEKTWTMNVDLYGERTEEEEEEEEEEEDEEKELEDDEMKYRLYKLVAKSRLTYLTSADDDLENLGQSEREWDEDMVENVEDEEQNEEKTDGLSYKLCQLEKEVGANQFSSTEDELDRVGVMDGERTGEDEELAVKVCKLANQVNATQFSSTEDELDRVGREEEEETIDDETPWKLQAEKAVLVAQLRDLTSLVSISHFSPTEHQPDGDGENEEVSDEGMMGVKWEEQQEKRESLGDLDVDMFDLRDGIDSEEKRGSDEEVTTENCLDVQEKYDQQYKIDVEEKRDLMEERVAVELEDEGLTNQPMCGEKVLKEVEYAKGWRDEKQKLEVERTEEIMSLNQTKVQQENQPEATWSESHDGKMRRKEETIGESKEEWETAAESDEDDAEFDDIISSMLMITLEDIQGQMLKDEAAENWRTIGKSEAVETNEKVKIRREYCAQETNASQETGSGKVCQRGVSSVTPEAAVEEKPGENVTKQVREDVPCENTSDQLEVDVDHSDKTNLAEEEPPAMTFTENREANQTCDQTDLDDDEEDKGGKVTSDEEAAGGSESKGTDLRPGEDTEDTEQSGTTLLQEALHSAEEIQIRQSAVSLRRTTTEVLNVLNATEDLLQGVDGRDGPRLYTSLPPRTDPKKLDQQFSRLEENVYMAASAVYNLETELSDFEECARGVCSNTSDMELSFLEEQVASAAAKVQQSELKISDISARIAALKSAGLNVETQSRGSKTRTSPVMPTTLDSSRHMRRRLPAPPPKEDKET